MTTARDIVVGALRLISATPEGNPPSDQMISDTLFALNELIDSWNTSSNRVYNVSLNPFTINQAKQIWTIGPNLAGYPPPDWVTPIRPMILRSANYVWPTGPALNIPLDILNDEEWAAIRMTDISTPISNKIYMDKTWPIANVYLWPIPTVNTTITLYYTELLSQVTLDTVINLPPGYAKALRYGTALAVSNEYGKTEGADIAGTYTNLLRDIMRANYKLRHMDYNSEAQGTSSQGTYNVYDDKVYGG